MSEFKDLEETPDQLRDLSRALRPLEAPVRVEQALVTAYRRSRRREPGSQLRWRLLAPVASAAVVVVAWFALWPLPETPSAAAAVAGREVTTDYMPIGVGLPIEASEFVQVIRISVPREDMVRFGLPDFGDTNVGRVDADVVLGEDGIARAIRFVQ